MGGKPKPKKVTLTVKRLNDSYEVKALESEKIQELVKVMAKALDKPEENLYFIFEGKILKNDESLQDLKIKDGSTLYLAIKQAYPGKRGASGLLFPKEAGEAGKNMAELCEKLINEAPNTIMSVFNSNENIRRILLQSPKIVEFILNSSGKLVKHIIKNLHSTKDYKAFQEALHKEFPQFNDPEFQDQASGLLFTVIGENVFNVQTQFFDFIQLWNLSDDIDEEKLVRIFSLPIWRNLLNVPFVKEFVVNFLPNDDDLFKPDDRRKILKSFVQNPQQGLEERTKLINEIKSSSTKVELGKRRSEDGEDNENEVGANKQWKPSSSHDAPKEPSAEEKFVKELELLKNMGFNNLLANIKALEDAGGDFDDAVEILIQLGH